MDLVSGPVLAMRAAAELTGMAHRSSEEALHALTVWGAITGYPGNGATSLPPPPFTAGAPQGSSSRFHRFMKRTRRDRPKAFSLRCRRVRAGRVRGAVGIGPSRDAMRCAVRLPQNASWLDAATRVVMLEFMLFSPSARHFAFVTLVRARAAGGGGRRRVITPRR